MISRYRAAAQLMYQQVSGLLEVFTPLRRSLGDVPVSALQFHQAQALLWEIDRFIRRIAADREDRTVVPDTPRYPAAPASGPRGRAFARPLGKRLNALIIVKGTIP